MPPVGFEPTIPASARPQIYSLDRAAAGIGDNINTIRYLFIWNLSSSVGLMTRLWNRLPWNPGSFLRRGTSPTQHIQPLPGTYYAGIKGPKREPGHSPPSDSEDKNSWLYTSAFPFVFWRRA
jgi:hypothetical protein